MNRLCLQCGEQEEVDPENACFGCGFPTFKNVEELTELVETKDKLIRQKQELEGRLTGEILRRDASYRRNEALTIQVEEAEAALQKIIEQINKYPMKMPKDPSVIDEKTLPQFINTLKNWGREGWATFCIMKCRVTDLEAYLDSIGEGYIKPWRDGFKEWKDGNE